MQWTTRWMIMLPQANLFIFFFFNIYISSCEIFLVHMHGKANSKKIKNRRNQMQAPKRNSWKMFLYKEHNPVKKKKEKMLLNLWIKKSNIKSKATKPQYLLDELTINEQDYLALPRLTWHLGSALFFFHLLQDNKWK